MERKYEESTSLDSKAKRCAALVAAVLAATLAGCATPSSMDGDTLAGAQPEVSYYHGA